MPTIIKPGTLDFQRDPDALKEFDLKTLKPRLGQLCGSTHFFFDIRELDPDTYSFPYHFHRNAEELIMILSGSFTLRTPDGLQVINPGELIFFEVGETGAHQFYNHGQTPCTYLDIRTTTGIDIAEYPDTGKINILPEFEIFEKQTRVGYNKGEEKVREVWNKLDRK